MYICAEYWVRGCKPVNFKYVNQLGKYTLFMYGEAIGSQEYTVKWKTSQTRFFEKLRLFFQKLLYIVFYPRNVQAITWLLSGKYDLPLDSGAPVLNATIHCDHIIYG